MSKNLIILTVSIAIAISISVGVYIGISVDSQPEQDHTDTVGIMRDHATLPEP